MGRRSALWSACVPCGSAAALPRTHRCGHMAARQRGESTRPLSCLARLSCLSRPPLSLSLRLPPDERGLRPDGSADAHQHRRSPSAARLLCQQGRRDAARLPLGRLATSPIQAAGVNQARTAAAAGTAACCEHRQASRPCGRRRLQRGTPLVWRGWRRRGHDATYSEGAGRDAAPPLPLCFAKSLPPAAVAAPAWDPPPRTPARGAARAQASHASQHARAVASAPNARPGMSIAHDRTAAGTDRSVHRGASAPPPPIFPRRCR